MVSRLLRDKGIREFIDAAKLVKARDNSVRFLLVGDVDDGNPTSLTADQLTELRNSRDVTWLGREPTLQNYSAQATLHVCLHIEKGCQNH